MELHNLKPAKGSVKKGKRIGRGEGSKRGGTATRGHKGQKSRSGYSKKIGFEGGQQPLQRRVPKFGFTNPNRVEYQGVNLDRLQELVDNKKIKTKAFFDKQVNSKKEALELNHNEIKKKFYLTLKNHFEI